MFEKNSVLFGLVIAILVPVVTFAFLYGLYEILEMFGWVSDAGFRPKFRERTTGIIAIGMNAILLNLYSKKRLFESVRGIVVSTVIWVGAWLWLYGKHVL